MLNDFINDFINVILEKKLNVLGIVVIKDGEKLAEHHFKPEIRRNLYSATKSFTGTAVGIAIAEGYFSLNDSILNFFKEDIPQNTSINHLDNLNKITVERLLTMSIKGFPMSGLIDGYSLQYILSIPLPNVEQRSFEYSNLSSYLAGVIVEKTTHMNMMDYLKPRLFIPLRIQNVECSYSQEGYYYGSSGMKLSVNELSRLGQLYLQKGIYQGKQLLTKEWVANATKKQIETREGGYGYYFWRHEINSYRASGMKGQVCIVIPEKNAVIAVMSDLDSGTETLEMRQCIWDTIYPRL